VKGSGVVDPTPSDRSLVLVVGAGRSGTSVVTGVLSLLGFHVPQPEVMANATNPRGFGEPRWVVDFHARMMKARHISLFDARPAAWAAAERAGNAPQNRRALHRWLAAEFGGYDRVVVKDPRTTWFAPLWTATATELAARPSFVTALRHPSEVLVSIRTTAGTPANEAGRAAWWMNMMLTTELVTRPFARGYLQYERLLTDWRGELARVGTALGEPTIAAPSPEAVAAVDGFIDPGLRRSAAGWDGVSVGGPVRDLAEQTWQALSRLADPDGDSAAARAELDRLRADYAALYADAESVAKSAIQAAREKAAAAAAPPPAPARPARRPPLRRRVARVARSARRRLPGG
jgi:hypothetical protein